MNLQPGTVWLDIRYLTSNRGSIREVLIERVTEEAVHVHTLSGQNIAKVQPLKHFKHPSAWTLQGHWSTDTTKTIPPIPFPSTEYEVSRLKYSRTALKLNASARVDYSLVPSLAPYRWRARDAEFNEIHVREIAARDMPPQIRYLDFEYVRDGGLKRLIYRRRASQWLLVRTLITPEEIEDHPILYF